MSAIRTNGTGSLDPPKRLRILFTEGSSLSARQTLFALGGRHEIDIIDPTRLCLCRFSRYVRRWYRCPSFSRSPEAYLEFLIKRLETRRYDVLVATHEQAYLVSRFQDRLSRHVHFAVPDFETIERTQSKVGFMRVLQELDLPHPATAVLRSYDDLDRQWEYPCYLKLAHGTAGNGVRLVRNERELRAAADQFRARGGIDDGNEYLVQQPAMGSQCTIGAVFQQGRIVGAHCFRTLIVGAGGGNLAREGVSHPEVVEHITALGAHLNWHGAMFIEYFYDSTTGRPEYFECNPRIGETCNAALSGVNLSEALVQVSLGAPVEPLPAGWPGIRSHSGFMVLMDKCLKGATRGELFSTLRTMRRQEGIFRDSSDELTRLSEDPISIVPAAWIAARLFAWPRAAHKIVRQTVDNYSLPEEAADRIRDLPLGPPIARSALPVRQANKQDASIVY